jgi:hypothetical protein
MSNPTPNFSTISRKYAAKHDIEELVNRFLFRGDQFTEQVFARQFLGMSRIMVHVGSLLNSQTG